MQVANDVASANELQVVKCAQAGALTTPPLPESCRAAKLRALERGLVGRERGVRGV